MNDSQDITFGRYLLRLFAWDGLLPPAIWLVPTMLRGLMPKNDAVVMLMTVLIPIAAVFVRYSVGMRYIRENHCGRIMRGLQRGILCCGILIMILIDTLSIAMQDIVPFAEQIVFSLVAFVFYLPLMAFALYPGFCRDTETRSEYEAKDSIHINAFGGEEYL